MMFVCVLGPRGRRYTLSVSASSTLQEVLEAACVKHGVDSRHYCLHHHGRRIDLSCLWRLSGLPNRAQLELVEGVTRGEQEADCDESVTVAMQLESGERRQTEVPCSASLWRVLELTGVAVPPATEHEAAVCVLTGRLVQGRAALQATTLLQLGLRSGRVLLRYSQKPMCSVQSAVTAAAPLSAPPISNKLVSSDNAWTNRASVAPSSDKKGDLFSPEAVTDNANITPLGAVTLDQPAIESDSVSPAENTSCIADNSSSIADNTSCGADNISCIADNASCIADNFSCIADNTSCIADNTSCGADNISCIADNSSCIADNSSCIADNTSCIADNISCGADNISCSADNTSSIADNTSCIADNTSCIADNTSCAVDSVDACNFLDDRQTVLFQPSAVAAPIENLPADFFEITKSDVQKRYRQLCEHTASLLDAPLLTREQQQARNQAQQLEVLARYSRCTARIRFPDGHVLQVTVAASETVQALVDAVTRHLQQPTQQFCLVLTVPRRRVLPPHELLLESDCVPRVLLQIEPVDHDGPPLLPSETARHRLTSASVADALAAGARRVRKTVVDTSAGGGAGSAARARDSAVNRTSQTTPKWFALNRKR